MEEKINEIKKLIEKPLSEKNIVVDSIEYTTENNYKFLKIILDKEGGIDLDTIVDATNLINPLIDEKDIIKEEYILDISSKERGNS